MVKKVNKTIDQPHENHCSYNEIVVIENCIIDIA